MKLTPIHVRGKRKAAAAPSASTPPPPSKMQRSIRDVKHTRQLQPRIRLDRLPAEILESILLYSGSVSLPRASPVIGAKLSSKATRLRFFIWGFHDTWDQRFGVPFMSQVEGPKTKEQTEQRLDPREAQYFPCDGDPELQTALLELPWVDIDFILRAQQTWADTYARHRWYEPYNEPGAFGAFDARRLFAQDYALLLRSGQNPMPVCTFAADVHPHVRLPLSLVTGPWDDEAQQRLFWLVRGGVSLESPSSPTRTLPWEYHREFLHNAAVRAETPNRVAHRCLMQACALERMPVDVICRERDDIAKRLQWGDDSDAGFGVLRNVLTILNHRLDYISFNA